MATDPLDPIRATDALAEIHNALEHDRSLVAIDLALRSLDREADEKTQRRSLRLLCRGALLHCGTPVPDKDRAVDAVFHPELSDSTRRFVAVCLLRALAANPDLFVDATLRNRTFLLFDAVLPDFYKESKIDIRRQTHEKEAALRSYVHYAERELEDVFRPLERMQDPGCEAITHSRNDILKLLKKYGNFLNHFVSKDLLGPCMDEQFGRVRDYIESDESSALHTYERAKAGLTSYGGGARIPDEILFDAMREALDPVADDMRTEI